jgi:hypothetical protein
MNIRLAASLTWGFHLSVEDKVVFSKKAQLLKATKRISVVNSFKRNKFSTNLVKKTVPYVDEVPKTRSISCICTECGKRNVKYAKIYNLNFEPNQIKEKMDEVIESRK